MAGIHNSFMVLEVNLAYDEWPFKTKQQQTVNTDFLILEKFTVQIRQNEICLPLALPVFFYS